VQPHRGRLPRFVVDRHDVEPVGTFRRATLGKKPLRRRDAPPETSNLKRSACFLHRQLTFSGQYKQKSCGCHHSSLQPREALHTTLV
jgi:hypothetical protein